MKHQFNRKSGNKKRFNKFNDLKDSLKEFWNEYKQIKYGIVGIIILCIFIGIVILEPFIIPYPKVNKTWNDITSWDELPRSAAPVWVNWFTKKDGAPQESLKKPEINVRQIADKVVIQEETFNYEYSYSVPPNDIYYRAKAGGIVNLELELIRPDGKKILLAKKSIRTSNSKTLKVSLANESKYNTIKFAKYFASEESARKLERQLGNPIKVLFSEADKNIVDNPKPLTGEYKIQVKAAIIGKEAFLKNSRIVVAGQVYGILGTDSYKRDIWSGVIAGTKWAMLIGLLISFISVSVAVIYGVTSAYFGGWVDTVLMRIWEVAVSMPMIPVLIVVAAVWKPSIWSLIIMMSLFYWRGSVKTIRSMGLQIKEETYIEAAHALDASNLRIIFKHMIPQLIPYSFASMALMVPGAIIAEATLSLLGLGDVTVVTWGQILHDAITGGAVLKGIWWWVVPPGLFIAVMGMTFAFIGFAMDNILNPKLKTR